MSWNRRVIRHKSGDGFYYQIHEVYYDDKGNVVAWTENGVRPGAETLAELKEELSNMLEVVGVSGARNEKNRVLDVWELEKNVRKELDDA